MSRDSMQYRQMGRAGLKLSALSLGGWTTFGGSVSAADDVKRILTRAFDAGVNFFDIADIYAKGDSETAMGAVLKDFPRHELVISSKVFWPMSDDVNDRGLSRKHIMDSVHKSLKRIGTDHLDLYFCHRFDEDTALEETVRAMDDLVHQGKVLYWGTSEWSGAQLQHVHAIAERRNLCAPAVEQPQYSLLARTKVETDVVLQATNTGMGLVVWSPLGSGVLTGKYDAGVPAGSRLERVEWLRSLLSTQNLARVATFKRIADGMGVSRAQLALAWVLAKPAISSVITGATSVEQLEENLAALAITVPTDVMAQLDGLFALT